MDALKAIDTAIQCANEGYLLEHYEIVSLESARAAIAELIYVAKDARDSLSAANKIYSDGSIGILIDRLSAALANAGGGK
jgi:hypothetical protein